MSQIAIYVDEGVGSFSLRHLVKNLRRSVDPTRYSIKRMDVEVLQKEEWESKTALLIIPGGRDVFYHAFAYFNGGCFFEAPEQHGDATVLGRYGELKGSPAAIVLCSVGKGRALLSGVHVEYLVEDLSLDHPHFHDIVPQLERTKKQGRRLFCDMLELSGIEKINS